MNLLPVRHFRLVSLCLSLALLVATQAGEARSTHKEFSKAWEARSEAYAQDFDSSEAEARSMAENLTQLLTKPTTQEEIAAAVDAALDASRKTAVASGRYNQLISLRDHIKDKPSAGLSELWFQSQVDSMSTELAELDAMTQKFERNIPEKFEQADQPLKPFFSFINKVEEIVQKKGFIEGKYRELQLIDQNLASYHQERSIEIAENREKRRSFFAAFANALAQRTQTQQQYIRTATTRCQKFGDTVNCNTNY